MSNPSTLDMQDDMRGQKVGPLSSLKFRDFRFFVAQGALQGISRNMRETLTFFLVYDLSGSAIALGLTGLFQVIPVLILGLLGGALADSMNRRSLIVITQVTNTFSAGLLAFLVFLDLAAVWHLWVLTAFWSGVNAMGRPAHRALVPRLVPSSHIVNAITWYGAVNQGALFLGPIIAGFLLALLGVAWPFVINAAVLIAAVFMTLAIHERGIPEGGTGGVSLRAIWDGMRFVRFQQVLVASLSLDFGVMAVGFFRPLMPILAFEVYDVGVAGLGIMNAAPALGSVVGSLILLLLGDIRRKGVVIVAGYFAYATSLVVLGVAPWFAVGLLALALLGLTDVVTFTVRQALMQIVAPDEYRGRAASLASALANMANATGAAQMGMLAAVAGAPGALIINGVLAIGLASAVTSRWRVLWRFSG